MFQTDRLMVQYVKLATGEEYPYIEFPVTQQESLVGFYLEIISNSLTLAASPSSILLGVNSMNPIAETAANTLHNVNAGAAANRIIGDIDLDFTAQLTNRVLIRPALAIGATTPPVVLLPIFGLYIKEDGLKLNLVYKSRGDI
jgi:hypothetical protein